MAASMTRRGRVVAHDFARAAAAAPAAPNAAGIDSCGRPRAAASSAERVGEREAVAPPVEIEHLGDRPGRCDVVDERPR